MILNGRVPILGNATQCLKLLSRPLFKQQKHFSGSSGEDGKSDSRTISNSSERTTKQRNIIIPSDRKNVGIIGALLKHGQPHHGIETAPASLRENQLLTLLNNHATVTDHGDHSEYTFPNHMVGNVVNPRTVGTNNYELCKRIQNKVRSHDMVLTLGGDHSLAIGTVYGHYMGMREKPAIIWVDAHADINTPESTVSGNLHGTPVSFLLKEFRNLTSNLVGFDWIQPVFLPDDIAYIGLRDVEPQEQEYLERLGIAAFSMADVNRLGIKKVLEECLKRVDPDSNRNIHLSFDIDAMDPSVAPATGTPVKGGLLQFEGEFICEELYATGRLKSVDMVEINPEISDDKGVDTTIATAISLLEHCVGRKSYHHTEEMRELIEWRINNSDT